MDGAQLSEYRGDCRRCGREHILRNDGPLAFATLEQLFLELRSDPSLAPVLTALEGSPGKMIGVAVVQGDAGERHVLRAYSGELGGRSDWPGWAAPVLRREDTAALEELTLRRIHELEEQLAQCDVEGAQRRLMEMRVVLRSAALARKLSLRAERLPRQAMVGRAAAARMEDREQLVRARQALLAERERAQELRHARREASRALSTALFDSAALTNARGERRPLREVFVGTAIAGGTADCAIPKLLEAANVARLRPVALAEAWWGPTLNGRRHGAPQGPCEKKCRPILGHFLCGLEE